MRDRAAVIDAVNAGVEEFGRLDIVSANAGKSPVGGMTVEIAPDEWNAVIDINLTGVFDTVAATVPAVIAAGNGGSIILTSSGAGLKYVPNLVHYNSAKAAVVAIAKALSNELAAQQVMVNVIAPGGAVLRGIRLHPHRPRLARHDGAVPGTGRLQGVARRCSNGFRRGVVDQLRRTPCTPVLHPARQDDSLIPVEQARGFATRLRDASEQPVVYAELPCAQHAFDTYSSARAAHTAVAVQQFLAEIYSARERT